MCHSTNSITSEVFPEKEIKSLKRPETVRKESLMINNYFVDILWGALTDQLVIKTNEVNWLSM